uniref:C2H2-type domain-containing protein n=1 Tax=Caenorhabditis tropicalis TaxID=1561998 RepID=A0A1I7TF57_9PELO
MYGEHHGQNNQMPPVPPTAQGQAPGNRGDGFGMYNPTDYVPFGGPIAPGQAPGNRGDKKWRCLLAPCLISFEYAGQLRFHMRDRHGIDYFDGKKQIATWYSN